MRLQNRQLDPVALKRGSSRFQELPKRDDQLRSLFCLENDGIGLIYRPWRQCVLAINDQHDWYRRPLALELRGDQRGFRSVPVEIENHCVDDLLTEAPNSVLSSACAEDMPAVIVQQRAAQVQFDGTIADAEDGFALWVSHSFPLSCDEPGRQEPSTAGSYMIMTNAIRQRSD